MKRPNLRRVLVSALFTVAVLAAPASAAPRARVFVRIGPPAPLVEARIAAPGPGYLWVPGYYTWDGSAYIWTAGRWTLRPRKGALWVPGHWQRERRGWFFIEGHWR